MKKVYKVKILKNIEIGPGIYELVLSAKEIVEKARPGQFVNIYCKGPGLLLPRPISISEIDKKENTLKLIYAVVGKGTKALSEMKVGEEIEVLEPLGNGFMISKETQNHMVIGGGIGVPPLVELVKELEGNVEVYLGFRSDPILVDTFMKLGAKVYVATEDGSAGSRGNVMDILRDKDPNGHMIYGCGPKPMLKGIGQWADERGIKAQLSMEERMACGIGACVGCTCKTKKDKKVENKRVCKDGPVFWSSEVIWDD